MNFSKMKQKYWKIKTDDISKKSKSKKKIFKIAEILFFKFELSVKDSLNSRPLEIYHNSSQLYILSEKLYRMEVSCLIPMSWLKT